MDEIPATDAGAGHLIAELAADIDENRPYVHEMLETTGQRRLMPNEQASVNESFDAMKLKVSTFYGGVANPMADPVELGLSLLGKLVEIHGQLNGNSEVCTRRLLERCLLFVSHLQQIQANSELRGASSVSVNRAFVKNLQDILDFASKSPLPPVTLSAYVKEVLRLNKLIATSASDLGLASISDFERRRQEDIEVS